MSEGLKACPCCNAIAYSNDQRGKQFKGGVIVGCTQCNLETWGQDPADAIKSWNTRPGDRAITEAEERGAREMGVIAVDLFADLEDDADFCGMNLMKLWRESKKQGVG